MGSRESEAAVRLTGSSNTRAFENILTRAYPGVERRKDQQTSGSEIKEALADGGYREK